MENKIENIEEKELIKVELELTKKEADYLSIEMNMILRSYGRTYAGKHFDNEDMGNAFNKLFKALSKKDHHQWLKVQK